MTVFCPKRCIQTTALATAAASGVSSSLSLSLSLSDRPFISAIARRQRRSGVETSRRLQRLLDTLCRRNRDAAAEPDRSVSVTDCNTRRSEMSRLIHSGECISGPISRPEYTKLR